MDDLIGTVADMVIEEYSTGKYNNGELIAVNLLKYREHVSELHHRLNRKGYENVIHNVDGKIAVEIKGELSEKVKLIHSYGTWTIGKKKPLRDGVKIKQDDESGILRLSHKSTDRGQGGSVDIQHWVIVTEDYRLVALQ